MYFSFGDTSRKGAKEYLSRKENQIKTLPSRAVVWLFPLSSIRLHNHFRAEIILKGFHRKFKLR